MAIARVPQFYRLRLVLLVAAGGVACAALYEGQRLYVASNRPVGAEFLAARGRALAGRLVEPPGGMLTLAATLSAPAHPERDSAHVEGIRNLLLGKPANAVRLLRAAAERAPRNARVWNDLSVAEFAAAGPAGDTDAVLDALAAADRALQLDPALIEARYNHALAVSALGLRDVAAELWREDARAEPTAERRGAAYRQARSATWPRSASEQWQTAMSRCGPRTVHAVDALARAFPEHARTWAETVFLSDWAQAAIDGDPAANAHLELPRQIGRVLLASSGDSLVAESVAAIDEAIRQKDAPRLATLAEAYLAYRRGRLLIRDGEYARSATALESARLAFRKGSSPMSEIASYYLAATVLSRSDTRGALKLLRKLTASERRAKTHFAALGYILWTTAVAEETDGHWTNSIHAAQEALQIFTRLGEGGNAAGTHNLLAEEFVFLGDPVQARSHSAQALRLASTAGDSYQLQVAVGIASRAEIRRERWQTARALAALELRLTERTQAADLITHALARIAFAEYRLGDHEASTAAIQRAATVAQGIDDRELRVRLVADVTALHGTMLRDRDPRGAVALLSQSIAFHERTGRTFALPELYLERGRCCRAADDEACALRDLDLGITVLESQRALVHDLSVRTGMLDDSRGLFTEAVELRLRRREVAHAFGYAERGRARALLDEIGVSGAGGSGFVASDERVRAQLGPGTVLLEYVVGPDRLIIFVADKDSLSATAVPISAKALDRSVGDLMSALTGRQPVRDVRRRAMSLNRILIAPVRRRIGAAKRVIIIPDGTLQSLPFSVLVDANTGHYLIEDVAVAKSPSASIWVETENAYVRRSATPARSAAIFTNPSVDPHLYPDLPVLRAAGREGLEIAGLYRRPLLLRGSHATRDLFLAEVAAHAVGHYGGHALIDGIDPKHSSILLAKDDDGSDAMTVEEIARYRFDRTRVVVLAACSTLAGPTETAEGAMSLARAFIVGGVPSVVGTLWDVDDAPAAEIAYELHRGIAGGVGPADALRAAQIAAIRSSRSLLRNPHSWAAFEVVGAAGD